MNPSCKSNIHLEIAGSVAAADSGIAKNVLTASMIIPGHKLALVWPAIWILIILQNWPWQFQLRLRELPGGASRLDSFVCSSARGCFLLLQLAIFTYLAVSGPAKFEPSLSQNDQLSRLQFGKTHKLASNISSNSFYCLVLSPSQYICWRLISSDTTAAPLNPYAHPLFLGSWENHSGSRSFAPGGRMSEYYFSHLRPSWQS